MQQPFDLSGQVVAITGASSGFGHHFAGVLAEAGAKVILGARRTDKLAARVEEIIAGGGEAAAAALDVREKDSIGAFLDVAYETYGRLDCVINNAGVEAGAKTYHTIDEEDWDFVLDTNLKSAWLVSKLYTDRVVAHKQDGGNIIMIMTTIDNKKSRHLRGVTFQKADKQEAKALEGDSAPTSSPSTFRRQKLTIVVKY